MLVHRRCPQRVACHAGDPDGSGLGPDYPASEQMFSNLAWFQLNESPRKVGSPVAEGLICLRGFFCEPLHWRTCEYRCNWHAKKRTHETGRKGSSTLCKSARPGGDTIRLWETKTNDCQLGGRTYQHPPTRWNNHWLWVGRGKALALRRSQTCHLLVISGRLSLQRPSPNSIEHEPRWESTVGEQIHSNIHLAGVDLAALVRQCEARDRTLPTPKLMLHALQVNFARRPPTGTGRQR
jgi:hypothetical protein